MYDELKKGSGKQQIATTMAFVRLLRDLMKDPEIGHRIVPIAPDEYRTFGMDSMFPSAKIYNPAGQTYESVDRKLLLAYKESTQGQLLHEGISEAGAMASATAAGSCVLDARRADDPGLHLLLDVRLPADRRLDLGDGRPAGARLPDRRHRRSYDADRRRPAARRRPLAADRADQPGRRALRPGVRLRDQPHRQVRPRADVRHVQTPTRTARTSSSTSRSTTRRINQPAEPEERRRRGPAQGRLPLPKALAATASGAHHGIRRRQCRGRSRPRRSWPTDYGVAADVWSVTSWNELARDAVEAEQWNLNHPGEYSRMPYITVEAHGHVSRHGRRQRLHARRARPDRPLGARSDGSPSVPTASASPTRARPPVVRSRSTPSRSSSRCCRRWPSAARCARDGTRGIHAVPHRRSDCGRRREQVGGDA